MLATHSCFRNCGGQMKYDLERDSAPRPRMSALYFRGKAQPPASPGPQLTESSQRGDPHLQGCPALVAEAGGISGSPVPSVVLARGPTGPSPPGRCCISLPSPGSEFLGRCWDTLSRSNSTILSSPWKPVSQLDRCPLQSQVCRHPRCVQREEGLHPR